MGQADRNLLSCSFNLDVFEIPSKFLVSLFGMVGGLVPGPWGRFRDWGEGVGAGPGAPGPYTTMGWFELPKRQRI